MGFKRLLCGSIVATVLLVSAPITRAHDHGWNRCTGNNHDWSVSVLSDHVCEIDDINIEIDGHNIIITNDFDFDSEVEITRDQELYVNGDLIELDEFQQDLVSDFHEQFFDIISSAKAIGWQGAGIGIEGAKLGLKAMGRIIKMIFTDYDEDDLEHDMDRDARILEVKAEKLESKAEIIEEMAEELEELSYELYEEIPELRRLDWF